MITRDDILPRIAVKHLGIPTLQERKSDGLDFHTVPVWAVQAALKAAYEEGQLAAKRPAPPSGGLQPFDGYEIHPVRSCGSPDVLGRTLMETCDPSEAECWSLYGHIPGLGVECIGDFQTRKFAEEILERITGRPCRIPEPGSTGGHP